MLGISTSVRYVLTFLWRSSFPSSTSCISRRRGEELRDGGYSEERLIGLDWLPFLDIGLAVSLGEENLPVLHDGDRGAWNVVVLELMSHVPVEERLDLPFIGRFTGALGR